ncbi:MAG: nucleotide exchange factor GrpE [Anaerolineae bacterium]|nr:nucleotide exchange factor GrpE [Anaerolineae bacterium]
MVSDADQESLGAAEMDAPATEERVCQLEQRIGELEASLAEAERQAKEYLDGWQRERASFANYRRRIEEERTSISQAALEDFICQFLPLLDDLERACGDIPEELAGHPWVEGVRMVERKFRQLLESLGVEEIEAEGCKFDPEVHEAITHEEAEGFAEGDVIGQVLKGYRLGDRILRCSVVRVAKSS